MIDDADGEPRAAGDDDEECGCGAPPMLGDLADAAPEVVDSEAEHEDRYGERHVGEVARQLAHELLQSEAGGVDDDVDVVTERLR
jgi:hypothetical protein